MSEENECCKDVDIIDTGIEFVCRNCGIVKGQILVGNERRAYNQEEVDKRRQHESRWREIGNRTAFRVDVDGKGNFIKDKSKFTRLLKIQKSLINSWERNMWESSPKFRSIGQNLNLPDHIPKLAWKIYNEAVRQKLTKGRTLDGFIAASIYAAIRWHKLPILLEEVSAAISTPRHNLTASLYLLIQHVLQKIHIKWRPMTSDILIERIGSELKVPITIQHDACKKLNKCFKSGVSKVGKDPKGFSAAILYILTRYTDHRKTQKEISEVAKVTDVTIRSRIAEIKEVLNK